jgi:tRNA nucleotidyltransferase (CCA-adding enzyme)
MWHHHPMKIYLVGGAVRDKLLNLEPTERDWVVVGARAEDLLAEGFKPVGKDFPVFIHPTTGDEYALARTERKSGSGYTGFTCYSSPDVTLEEDLLRRDLTINAMAMDDDGTIIDPYGGIADLQQKLLRHVSDAFVEDPLRVLRVARFAARFYSRGFRIAAETLQLMRDIAASGELDHLVAERIWKETERSLSEPHPEIFFRTLQDCEALPPIFPELCEHISTHGELLQRIATRCADPVLRLAYALSILDEPAINQLADRLRLPNQHRDAALIIHQHRHLIDISNGLHGHELFEILETLDALRRPQRVDWLCTVIETINPSNPLASQLRKALQLIAAVEASEFIAQGLSGAKIGEAMRNHRLHILQEYFS